MSHTGKHRVDHLKGLINLLSNFGSRQHDLTAHENQKHNLGLDHAVDKTREQLWFIRTEVVMPAGKTLETDRELDIARSHDVLDLEVGELGVEAELLNNPCVFAGSEFGVIFRLCARDHHLARGKNQRRGFGFTDAHDDGGKSLDADLAQDHDS